MAIGPMAPAGPAGMLRRVLLNPLAIGVTLGGLVLDVVAPRPKPRVGPVDLSPQTQRWREDTGGRDVARCGAAPVAGGEAAAVR